MQASEFNRKYPVGSHFIFQPGQALRGGRMVKTLDIARDLNPPLLLKLIWSHISPILNR